MGPDSFRTETGSLLPAEFIALSKAVGWGANRTYDMAQVERALRDTALTVTIRLPSGEAVACGRAFSDDLMMTFIPDVFVHPRFQKRGLGRLVIEQIKERYGHTVIFFGAQPGNEGFFEKLGFEKSLQSYSGRFRKSPYFG